MYSQQAAVEAVYSTTYVEDYIDAVVDLPDDLQKHLSRLREYDAECNRHVREVERLMDVLMTLKEKNDQESETASISISAMLQSLLVRTQEIGDQKLGVVQQIQDMLENKTSQLDIDQKNSGMEYVCVKQEPMETTTKYEPSEKKRARRARHDVFVQACLGPTTLEPTAYPDQPLTETQPRALMPPIPSTSHAAASSSQHHTNPPKPGPSSSANLDKSQDRDRASWSAHNERALANASAAVAKVKQEKKTTETDKKKQYKRRKTNAKQAGNSNSPPNNLQIDPDEPTYCLCDQVSYGDMIGCDNDLCPLEWFHFSCVSLTTKPKGKWYCPKCRGERATLMKPKALFLKELEKYNREREEKA